MEIKSAEFVISSPMVSMCPKDSKPEYAFIGRSNVGKSSLINMLCCNKKLAKTSATPGKTLLINHFIINKNWYLVALPGFHQLAWQQQHTVCHCIHQGRQTWSGEDTGQCGNVQEKTV